MTRTYTAQEIEYIVEKYAPLNLAGLIIKELHSLPAPDPQQGVKAAEEFWVEKSVLTNFELGISKEDFFEYASRTQPVPLMQWVKVERNDETMYTYYEMDLENISEDWNTTICESLEDVLNTLKYLDTHFEDDTTLEDGRQRQVVIRGIGMTQAAFKDWCIENLPQPPTP